MRRRIRPPNLEPSPIDLRTLVDGDAHQLNHDLRYQSISEEPVTGVCLGQVEGSTTLIVRLRPWIIGPHGSIPDLEDDGFHAIQQLLRNRIPWSVGGFGSGDEVADVRTFAENPKCAGCWRTGFEVGYGVCTAVVE